ncbi:MAG: NADH-quinone oxidoreductase subunit L [Nitrospirota bacterium]|nr:NADH-quinone oxidoreductase subunit L [Nitrospirota bacterium]MDH5699565.1 NADH-quinone oxidoreductase subunit L [Nitrospirota bacterium]
MTFFILIPLLPLMAVLILVLGKPWLGEQGHKIGIPAMALSFAFSTIAFAQVASDGAFSVPLYRLIHSGDLVVDLGLYVDQLTVLLLLLVTGVSSVVHVYASRYMIGDPRYNRFFAVIALFTFSMIMLVMSNNLLMMYVFWEIMGICSYLLIAHWGERQSSAQAATKAFLMNSVADVGLGFGVILTYSTFGTLDIQTILAEAQSIQGNTINLFGWLGLDVHIHVLTLITLFLFMGAMGKSAQVPFHVWLPFAMEAPTPVSALIHAATMVNAGPFLLVRMSPLVMLSPEAMTVIAVIGGMTALFATLVSLTQVDIKRMLAFSTIGQIGFMIMTCGVGAFVVSIFHMLAHGCLKGFLFLSTGNALRSVGSHGHEPTSFSPHAPSTHSLWPFLSGAVLLACLPPFLIFSGPYEQLWMAQPGAPAQWTFWILGSLTVFFSAMYVIRGVLVLFYQPLSTAFGDGMEGQAMQPRFFSPIHLLGILAGIGIVGSLLLILWSWFAQFLSPVVGHRTALILKESSSGTGLQLILALAVAVGGVAVGYFSLTKFSGSWFQQSEMGKRWYVHFLNKLYFDEMYEAYVVLPTLRFSRWLWRVVDRQVFDALIMGVANVSVVTAKWLWRVVDLRGIDGLVVGLGRNSVGMAGWLWRVVDLRGVDRVVVGIGKQSLGIANWLWKAIDIKILDKNVNRAGGQAKATGDMMRELEPRTLQHHLLVMIFWLIFGILLVFLFVL